MVTMINPRVLVAFLILSIAGSMHCDFVPALVPIEPQIQRSDTFFSAVNWCSCQFLVVGGIIASSASAEEGIIGVYQFDQPSETLSLTGTATLGLVISTVGWCPSCTYLAAGGIDFNGTNTVGIIQLYTFDTLNPGSPEPVGSAMTLGGAGSAVLSIDWCQSCSYLAALAVQLFVPGPSTLQVYSLDGILAPVDGPTPVTDFISSIKWCPDCIHLLAAGLSALYVYTFNNLLSPALVLSTSVSNNAQYNTIDSCDNCSYIAAGGVRSNLGIVDIYSFDSTHTPSLSLITTATIPAPVNGSSSVYSLAWCQDCDNLAVAGATFDESHAETDSIYLYHFNVAAETLSLTQQYTLNFLLSSEPSTRSLDWCGNCCDLVVGGAIGMVPTVTGIIQLFRGNPCGVLPTPTKLTAQKICHRFPTQVDIINQLCWDAVTGAVAYNVYADAALTILLATITTSPLCYSQHQITQGKTVTYYVTAVGANGSQSAPATVTI